MGGPPSPLPPISPPTCPPPVQPPQTRPPQTRPSRPDCPSPKVYRVRGVFAHHAGAPQDKPLTQTLASVCVDKGAVAYNNN